MLIALHPNCLHILGGWSSFVYAFGSGGVYFGGSGNLQPHFLHSLTGWSSLVLGLSKWLYILVIDHSPCLFFCNNYIFYVQFDIQIYIYNTPGKSTFPNVLLLQGAVEHWLAFYRSFRTNTAR